MLNSHSNRFFTDSCSDSLSKIVQQQLRQLSHHFPVTIDQPSTQFSPYPLTIQYKGQPFTITIEYPPLETLLEKAHWHLDFDAVLQSIITWTAQKLPSPPARNQVTDYVTLADFCFSDLKDNWIWAAKLVTFAYLYDDYQESVDPATIAELNRQITAALTHPRASKNTAPHADQHPMLLDFSSILMELLGAVSHSPLLQNFIQTLKKTITHAAFEITDNPNTSGNINTYLTFRKQASGVQPILNYYHMLRGNVEKTTLDHDLYQMAQEIGNLIISTLNDLVSLNKETREGKTNLGNLFSALLHEHQQKYHEQPNCIDYQNCLSQMVHFHNEELKIFDAIMLHCQQSNPDIYSALLPLQNWIMGHATHVLKTVNQVGCRYAQM